MEVYRRRNRSDQGGVNSVSSMEETEMVLKLNRDEILILAARKICLL